MPKKSKKPKPKTGKKPIKKGKKAKPKPRQNPNQVKRIDRKSTRLNSSHGYNSYAVFCWEIKM